MQYKLPISRIPIGYNEFNYMVLCPICVESILSCSSSDKFSDIIDILCKKCFVVWKLDTDEIFCNETWIPKESTYQQKRGENNA